MKSKDNFLLTLKHINKSYDSPAGISLKVLKDICLNVAQGDTVAIVGPSGSGKSTLLNIMGSLDRPSSGSVNFLCRNLSNLNDRELAGVRNRDIGFVFQLHHLLPQCTVLENVLIPTIPGKTTDKRIDQRARELLQKAGLTRVMDYRPGSISGGESQRAAVVRALINSPRLILADEPTGSLDAACADELSELLLDLNKEEGSTLIVVTHSNDLANRMKRQFKLSGGYLKRIEKG